MAETAVVRVAVSSDDGWRTGSGFFVNNTHIVTNEHVIASAAPAGDLFFLFPGSDTPQPVTLLSANPNLDLAVLAYPGGAPREPLPVSGPDPERGAEVFALGYPGPADVRAVGPTPSSTLTSGILSKEPFGARWGRSGSRIVRALQHTAPINPGSSGGPLVNACGQVVGVNTSGGLTEIRDADGNVIGTGPAQGIFFALAASELVRELRDLGVDFALAPECDSDRAAPAPETSGAAGRGWLFPVLVLLVLTVVLLARRARSPRPAPAEAPGDGGAPAVGGPAPSQPRRPSPGVRFAGASGAPDLGLTAAELAAARHGVSFGRNPRLVDRAIDDPSLSRRHFRISLENGHVFLEDLHSTHGTSTAAGSSRIMASG